MSSASILGTMRTYVDPNMYLIVVKLWIHSIPFLFYFAQHDLAFN